MVKLKATGRAGEITAFKEECSFKDGKLNHTKRYLISFASYINNWHDESELVDMHNYNFTKKFEEQLLNMMIDINLDNQNFDMVKNFSDLKKKLS